MEKSLFVLGFAPLSRTRRWFWALVLGTQVPVQNQNEQGPRCDVSGGLVWRALWCESHIPPTWTHMALQQRKHPIPSVAIHSNSSSDSRMQWRTAARMQAPSLKVRIGAGMPHGRRRGELGERVWLVLRAWERGLPRRPHTATKMLKGPRTCRNRTYSPRIAAACAAAACFVALVCSAQACGWQARRFREHAYVV